MLLSVESTFVRKEKRELVHKKMTIGYFASRFHAESLLGQNKCQKNALQTNIYFWKFIDARTRRDGAAIFSGSMPSR
jgi:hypothetical protein